MKNFVKLLFVLLIIFSCQTAFACTCEEGVGTDISGRKYENMTWTKANSPYCVTGNIIMSKNTTLTIEPGVVVKFWEGTDTPLNNNFNIIINGQLTARGTESEPIRFTSSRSPASPGDWGYIEFSEDATPAIFDENGEYLEGSILEHVTIEYGGGGDKSTVHAVKAPYLNRVTIQKNKSTGVHLETSAKIANSTFTNNNNTSGSYSEGGNASAVQAKDTLTISNCTFTNNKSSAYNGSAVNATGYVSLNITDSTFTNNSGGAVNGSGSITNCTFTNNNGTNAGAVNGSGTITNCTFINNNGNSGGAVNGYETISDSIFIDNTASSIGGAIYHYRSNVTISNCTFTNNSALNGGAIWESKGNFTISNSSFTNNAASENGGAVYAYGTVTISDSSFIGNTADTGIIYANGKLTLTDSLIYNSQSKNEVKSKYAVWLNSGEITRCTIADNPGGIYFESYNSTTISSSNIFGNKRTGYASSPYETLYDVYNNSANDIQATGNYWGTTEPSTIDANIFDKVDDGSKGEIIFWGADKFLSDFAPDAPVIPGALLEISPKNYNFGNTDTDTSATQTFTVNNIGSDNLVTGSLSLTGTNASEFSIQDDTCSNKTLSSSGTCTVNVVFSPTSEGVKNAELLIPFGESGENTKADLTGTGSSTVQPEYTVTFKAGTGGVVEGDSNQTVTGGSSCTPVTAVPNSGYQFAGWTSGENVISTENPFAYGPVNKHMNIIANFQPVSGCKAVITAPVTVFADQAVSFHGASSVPSSSAEITNFAWDFGNDSEYLGVEQSHIFSQAGTYTVSLQITDSNGCTNTATHEITVTQNNSFTVTFTSGTGGTITGSRSQTVQQGGTCTSVTAIPNTGYKFVNWTAGDSAISAENPLSYGPVTSNITIYANFAVDSPEKIQKAILIPNPAAVVQGELLDVTLKYDCTENNVSVFGVSIYYDSEMLVYEKYTPVSESAETYRFPNPDAEIIPYDDTEGIGGFVNGKMLNILYYSDAGFPGDKLPLELFKLSFRAQNLAGVTSIKIKGFETSSGFEFQGTNASITIGEASCDASAIFTATTSDLAASFNTTGSSGSLLFDYGDGSTGESTTHTYKAAGTYTVTLTSIGADECTDTKTLTITVSEPACKADATFTATPVSGIAPLTVSFDTSATKGSLLLDYGDNTTSATSTTYTYTEEGSYTVTLTASSGECTDSRTLTVTVIETSVPLAPPTNLRARSGTDYIKLSWKPSTSTDLAGYNIYRSLSENDSYSRINSESVTGDYYLDNYNLINATPYYYYLKALDTSDSESDESKKVSAVFGQLKFFINDAKGNTGDDVTLPINISNADGLEMCSVGFEVIYDHDILSVQDIEKTPLSAGYGWDLKIDTPGMAKAVIATARGEKIFGEGALFYLKFKVKGESGDTSELKFKPDGTYFYDCRDRSKEVPLDITDIGIFTAGPDFILGDVDGNGEIDGNDASLCLSIVVGNTEPADEQFSATDVWPDGDIRGNDCSLIMSMAAGYKLEDLIPASSEEKRARSFRYSPVNVKVPDVTASVGGSILMPINISDATDVASADIVLNYNPTLVSVENVIKTSMTEKFELEYHMLHPGQVSISLSTEKDDEITDMSGSLVEVQFTTHPDVSGTTPLTLASVRLNDSYGRDFATSALQTDITKINGSLEVKDNVDADLSDAIQALKVLAGTKADLMNSNADADGSGKVEMQDVIYILQIVSDIRH
ncbi:MAG: choice-of-anchor D domain-containing protein [Desulfobacterales bacterium]|nr:choice-of-anchor D domain-containing protein [Desulfobacterales bacterium]